MRVFSYPEAFQASICIEDVTGNARFVLGNNGQKPLMCFGINPSIANRSSSDPTMNWLIEYSKSNHFDSCIMMNPYPMRTSDPKLLPNDGARFLIEKNNLYIENVFRQHRGQTALAIWGDIVDRKAYIRKSVYHIIEISRKYRIIWKRLGELTDNGNPRHINSVFGDREHIHLQDLEVVKYTDRLT